MVFRRKKSTTAGNETLAGMRGRTQPESGSSAAPAVHNNPLARRFPADDEPETIDLIEAPRFHDPSDEQTDEDITSVLVSIPEDQEEPAIEFLDDPVSGFLVVIEGPGRGSVCTVGYGANPIGRDPGQRISLPFGDLQIALESHAVLTFDVITDTFHVQPGDGHDLLHLDDEPVLLAMELQRGNHLRLGQTVLRFVPLCGDGFSWDINPPGP